MQKIILLSIIIATPVLAMENHKLLPQYPSDVDLKKYYQNHRKDLGNPTKPKSPLARPIKPNNSFTKDIPHEKTNNN